MKKHPIILIAVVLSLLAIPAMRAVYAPIPEVEQGRLLTVYLGANSYYDSNIFGAPENAIDSFVFEIQPTAVLNVSSGNQTFLTASYQLSMDYFTDRPDDKLLASHFINARIAHTFSPRLELIVSDNFQIVKNPESLLPGLATVANPDQSYNYNQFDGRMSYFLTKRSGLVGKVRAVDYSYDNNYLKTDLDHAEYLAGLEWMYSAREELKINAEYRWQGVRYDHGGNFKDKNSNFLIVGADYVANKRTALSARVGIEALNRKAASDTVLPYVELGIKYDYSADSYISGGYTYSVNEPSNANIYTDMYVHRFFLNLQQSLGKHFTASCMVDWEPSKLNARKGLATDIDEQNFRGGLALTYMPSDRWSVSTTCDYDNVSSDDKYRELRRVRTGVRARWVF